jgi:KaiC/GvpD/RAD55 family RecA-like ATPase/FixJ family two-component response regulator
MLSHELDVIDEVASQPVASGTNRMVSTGIEAFDRRFGGVVRGRHYLLSGSPGSGKSSATLQFLGAGLEHGETCAILTQDDPQDLITQAEFLGYDFRSAAEKNRLIVLQYRLDFPRNYSRAADPRRVFDELRTLVQDATLDRFAIDSIFPFLEGGRATDESLDEFPEFLERLGCTSYLTIPGDLNDGYYRRIYDRLIAGAAGLFHFEADQGQVRQLSIRKLRQPAKNTDPFRFIIRTGVGIVEYEAPRPHDEIPDEIARRIVLLGKTSALPDEVLLSLQQSYSVVAYESIEHAFAELGAGRHGAIIVALNPRESELVFNLTRQLRQAGNGAPILFVSPSQGLRGSTRARGLRAGGDDFLTDLLSPEEFLERIEVARARGHRRRMDDVELEPFVLQPVDAEGRFCLMPEREFREVVRGIVAKSSNPFFALVRLAPAALTVDEAWQILSGRLRVKEGDLGAQMQDGRIVLFLKDIRRRQVDTLLERLMDAYPGLGRPSDADVYSYPTDRHEVDEWLAATETTAA